MQGTAMGHALDHSLFDQISHSPQADSLQRRLRQLHSTIKQSLPFVDRIAGALYDAETDVLKTFIYSTDEHAPLAHYEFRLSEAPSLIRILQQGEPRAIDDLEDTREGQHEHTQRILDSGFRSSYTVPMYHRTHFLGFVFFNSYHERTFTPMVQTQLDFYSEMVALMIINELQTIRTLRGAVNAAKNLAGFRDLETGSHQKRMAHYSRLIALEVANHFGKDDDYIEHLFLFAPLHDIGKLAIPDNILLKPSALTSAEFEVMKTHTVKGLEITETLLRDIGLEDLPHLEVLKNLVYFHHEAWDGDGYPSGLGGEDIPLEARIIAVADMFDALTSARPYKDPWSLETTVDTLKSIASVKLDPVCVEALTNKIDNAVDIMQRFKENTIG